MRLLAVCLAALAAALLSGRPAEAATPTRYEIAADLDVARARLVARQRTTYVNETGQPPQYTPIGDPFLTEAADYDATLRPSTRVVAAVTGQIVARDGDSFRAVARGVRDFAIALSPRYESASTTVDGVTVTAYFLP